jgi:hypothetical protein
VSKPTGETKIVRPFGLIGGPYEIDSTGLRYYRRAWISAVFGLLAMNVAYIAGLPLAVVFGILAVALIITIRLCLLVVRNGKRVSAAIQNPICRQ